MQQHDYTVEDIRVMEGLEAVRVRPGMYIGSTGSRGLHHMLWEIVDNAVDEAANGYANEINVTINKDNSVTVEDNGRAFLWAYMKNFISQASRWSIHSSMQAASLITMPMASPEDCTASALR